MITIGLLGCLAVAALVIGVLGVARGTALEVTFSRLAWLPVTALVIEVAFAKPALSRLSYFAIVPVLLTCLVSLLMVVAGATLAAAARQRSERTSGIIRATVVAAIPGMLFFVYMAYGFAVALIRR